MLLTEFDANRQAIINPEALHEPLEGFPKIAVSCFSRLTFQRMLEMFPHELIYEISMANVAIPIYKLVIDEQELALFNAPVGASACVAILEDIFALGTDKLVLFGTCGVLDEDIKETSIIIPSHALRDEGTSFHYVEASNEIAVNVGVLACFRSYLNERQISHKEGKVWTTDGIYRETNGKLKARKEAGAICVDMECSAVAALAAYRGFELCHFFYAADHLSEEKWDIRTLSSHEDLDGKDRIAELAIQFALFWEKAN